MCSDPVKSDVNTCSQTEYGGYLELALPDYGDPFPDRCKFQSARAAIRAVLEAADVKHVYLPVYICNTVQQAVKDCGVDIELYDLDDSLYPKKVPGDISKGAVFLYVNYFGLCGANVERLQQGYLKEHLIIDNSQALFAPPSDVLANIYSLRKFIGVPDGGLLVTNKLDIKMPEDEDQNSLGRMDALLSRSAYSARQGYPMYVENEKALNDTKPLQMSLLTKRLLASVDLEQVRKKRRENFIVLEKRFGKCNKQDWDIGIDTVPLCYPLVLDVEVEVIKSSLADNGVFIPKYWPDIQSRTQGDSLERRLLKNCLFIPCDQRYTTSQIDDMADIIISSLKDEIEIEL